MLAGMAASHFYLNGQSPFHHLLINLVYLFWWTAALDQSKKVRRKTLARGEV